MAAFRHIVQRLGDRSGAALVEFAVIAPFLFLLLIAAVDLGLLVHGRTDMFAAVQAGAQYFMVGGKNTAEATALVDKMWNTRPEVSSLSVESFCQCGTTMSACMANCADGTLPVAYHRIIATATYKPLFLEQEFESNEVVRTR